MRCGMRQRGRWITAALLVLLLAIGLVAYQRADQPAEPEFRTAKVERGRITARVTATGVLSALVTVQVGSQVSGRIQEIHADFNAAVTKGQVIARIDAQLYQAAVEQARANALAAGANLSKAKAQLTETERQYERAKQLREKKLIAQADFDTAETNRAAAEAQVEVARGSLEQAKAALHQAEVNLGYTSIVSPINGVVISRNVDVGQTVAASLQAPTLFTIAEDLRKMQVDTNIAEADVGKIRAGMTATFRVDSYPTEPFTGLIRQIRNAPQTIQNVVTYDAVIDVDNSDLRLKPGMTANVTVVYDERENVLKTPNTALRFRATPAMLRGSGVEARPGPEAPAGDRRTLWVLSNGRAEPVSIRIGLSDGTSTEIVEGPVQENDLLVTEAKSGDERGTAPGGSSGAFRRIF